MKVSILSRLIAIDYPTSGIEVYTKNIYSGLLKKGVIVTLIPKSSPIKVSSRNSFLSPILYDFALPIRDILFRKLEADVFHSLYEGQGHLFPLLKGSKVVTVHHIDNDFQKRDITLRDNLFRLWWDTGTNLSIKYADQIIAVSTQTKTEIMKKFDINEDIISVINHGITNEFRPLNIKNKLPITVGYLGGLDRRKNVDFLIRSFSILSKKYNKLNLKLIICGGGPNYLKLNKLTKKLGLKDKVKFTGYVHPSKIVEIYNSFSVFVFPSLHEGFGLPILEAQKCGVPVIILKKAQIPQEVGKFAIKAYNETDMADKIYNLITNKKLSEKIMEKGIKHAKIFTWEKCVDETIKVYEKLSLYKERACTR